MRNRGLMRFINGDMVDLHGDELERFFIFAYKTTRINRTMVAFGMPVLFLTGWLRDIVLMPDDVGMLLRRGGIVAAMLLCSVIGSMRSAGHWRELAGIVWSALAGIGIMISTLTYPDQITLAHVVTVLMVIILLPHALRPIVMSAVLMVLVVPLLYTLHRLQMAPELWPAYLLFILLGCIVGMVQRRAQLNGSLEVFQLRGRLLARLHTDSLTNILNREGWEVNLQRFKRRDIDARPYSVVYFDLDHFKRVNDREGHAMGDRILRNAAEIMRERSRSGEILARLGGEEFVSLLPGANENSAWAYAERIRKAIETSPSCPVQVTISAGVAEATPQDALEALITRADNAMLEAKRRGRNQVLRASEISEPLPWHTTQRLSLAT